MSYSDTPSWQSLLRRPLQYAVLAVSSPQGQPWTRLVSRLDVDEHDRLVYLEFFESSVLQQHLVHSLWFNRPVSLLVQAEGHGPVQIQGIPRQAVVAGPEFERYYREAQESDPRADLAAVWHIEVTAFLNESHQHHAEVQSSLHPIVSHLDHFARV